MLSRALSVLSAGALTAGLVLVAPIAAAAAVDPLAPPNSPQTGTVGGVFTDPAGVPVPNASVTSRSPDHNNRVTRATTDQQGRYRLDDVPAGPVALTFRSRFVQYAPGRPRESEAGLFTVVPGLTTVVNERRVATGTVRGRLTDAAGTPLAGGTIVVTTEFGGAALGSATTDADGRYSFAGVPAGTFTMSFRAAGRTQWAHDAAGPAAATVFTMAADQIVTVDESMRATGSLAGRVNRATGPVRVYAYEVGGEGVLTADTDADGRYRLADVPVGRWQVRLDTRQWVPGKIGRSEAQVFEVTAGRRTLVNDRLRPTGSLRVSLRTPGLRLSRWQFVIWHNGEEIATKDGTSVGRQFFLRLLPGDYVFGYRRNGVNFYAPGTVRPENAVTKKVRPGARRAISVNHPADGTLSGRVTLPTGEPLQGIRVRADVDAGNATLGYSATTGPDGTWRIDRVFPERYRVRLSNATGKLTQDAGLSTVTSGATSTLDAQWRQGGSLTVNAVDAATGAPVTGFCVALVAKYGDYCTAGSTVTAAGLEAGKTLVTLTPRTDLDYLVARDAPATVPAGGHATITVPVTLGGRIHLEFRQRATGEPEEFACLIPVAVGAGRRGLACGNRNGRTTTAGLPEGVYQLFVQDSGSAGAQWYRPEGGTGDQREATRFRVRAGHTVKAGTALMDKAGTVSGVVRDPAGTALAGVDVDLRAYDLPGDGDSLTATTDQQGRYTLRNVGPYSWPLLFTPAGDLPRQWSGGTGNRFQAETVAVAGGSTSTYDTTLVAGAKVSGVVTVAPGGPAWSGGRLTARNVASGDVLAWADLDGQGGAYELSVIGGRPVTLDWYLADPVTKRAGRYPDEVRVPAEGRRQLDLTIG